MNPSDKPDLDLIALIQRARLQHDDDTIPSQVAGMYWIEAKRETEGDAPTPRAGRWIITTTAPEVDALWAKIKDATKAGRLGYKSKVSTAAREMGLDKNDRVIHVVTCDADDTADVERVRRALRELGVDENLHYQRVREV